jgi:hypothetical protein
MGGSVNYMETQDRLFDHVRLVFNRFKSRVKGISQQLR